MNLLHKTKNSQSLRGKPRVYFCCHSEDFEKYFQAVSDEILELQSCAIWYKDPAAEYGDSLLADLKEMQLFVVPVTAKLLTEGNPALDTEFRFALENHIPVLPLMQEGGLEELFNARCGDLQFLDKSNSDITAISFEEKLKKYLEAVLIGDELAKEIRAAFDAYVFLSYRKKDRKHARELMRLIHENDFCRDIAIWYDEFLTPGENFNDSIKAALDKSDIFLLAVTPNLVNENNYIITTEYPMALNSKKPIIPAELVPTSRALLSEKFENLPPVADARNANALKAVLLQAIGKAELRNSPKDSAHRFFIGLAYLGGVDVEVNFTLALQLITSAAEEGLPQAMEKLVSMFRNGIGVGRDRNAAIGWQKKLVEENKRQLAKEPNDANYSKCIQSLIALGVFYYELRDLAEAEAAYTEALEYSQQGNRSCATILDLLADIAIYQKNYPLAKERSLAVLSLCDNKAEPLAELYRTGLQFKHLSKLGEIESALGNDEKARQYLFKSFEYLKLLASGQGLYAGDHAPENPEDYSATVKHFLTEYLNKFEGTLTDGAVEFRVLIATYYQLLAVMEYQEDNWLQAKVYFAKALEHCRFAVEKTENLEAVRLLAASHEGLGEMEEKEGSYEAAEANLEKSLELQAALAKKTDKIEDPHSLATTCLKLGVVTKKQGKTERSKHYFKMVLQLAEPINTRECKTLCMLCHHEQVGLALDEKHLPEAKLLMEKELKYAVSLAKTGDTDSRKTVCELCELLGEITAEINNGESAEQYYRLLLETANGLVQERQTVETLGYLASGCFLLGVESSEEYLLKEAFKLYRLLAEICPEEELFAERLELLKDFNS